MQHLCREYTIPRNEKKIRAKRWILKNTRIGPVSNIKVCYHEDRYTTEVLIQSLYQDRTASWVGIVKGVDKSPMKKTGSHFLTSDGEHHIILNDKIALEIQINMLINRLIFPRLLGTLFMPKVEHLLV